MTSKITDFLQTKSAEDRRSGVLQSRQDRIGRWKAALDDLFDNIESWLKESIDSDASNTISHLRIPTVIAEDVVGPYSVDKLVITVGARSITAEPRGAFVLGAQGRVDLHGSNGEHVIVVLVDGQWRYTTLAGRGSAAALLPQFDEDGFLAALEILLGSDARD